MSNAAILASFAWQAACSLAAPTPNNTANPDAEPGWRKEPKGRGTFSIILTSVLTLGLCVWTAIHPNVKPNASAWQKVRHRLLFVAVGMLAPEIVLAVAFYEWREARKFHREWCELYGIDPGSEEDTLRMKGAFFVTMGGVSFVPAYKVPANFENVLSTSAYLQLAKTDTAGVAIPEEKFEKLTRRATHAAAEPAKSEEAVELLELDTDGSESEEGEPGNLPAPVSRAEPRVSQGKQTQGAMAEAGAGAEIAPAPVISREFVHHREVQDKGKAEFLGKSLVCLQALWMLLQCIVRKASGLPVTLLEIHVAMHVICAIGMYGFWFNKPQDVGEPLPVPGTVAGNDPVQLAVEIIGHMSTDGDNEHRYQGRSLYIQLHLDPAQRPTDTAPVSEYVYLRPLPTTRSVHFSGDLTGAPARGRARARARVRARVRALTRPSAADCNPHPTLAPAPAPAPTDPTRLLIPIKHKLDLGPITVRPDLTRTCVMPSEDLDLLRRAAEGYQAGKRSKWPRLRLLKHVSTGDAGDILDDLYVSNIFPAIFILLVYGACHAAAWNTHFPSPAECLLWRISSIVIAIIPAYILFLLALSNGKHKTLLSVLTLYFSKICDFLEDFTLVRTTTLEDIFLILTLPLLLAILMLVLLGRLYLFVESFLSLRSLPFGSFNSTPWEDYFPHL